MNGGIGRIEMLKKTNILALVGGGQNPRFPPNKIIIWDDHQGRIISILRFNKNILNVRLTKEKIFGILDDKIYIVNLNTLETYNVLQTFENPTGIMGMSDEDSNKLIIAYPLRSQGIVNFRNCITKKSSKDSKTINCHESKLSCLSINKIGTLLATASDKGTLIRIFAIQNGDNISVFRRGSKNVSMNCITFSNNNMFIGCTSNAETIHIFSIAGINKKINKDNKINGNHKKSESSNEIISNDEPKNHKSLLGKISVFLKLNNDNIEQELSFAKFRVPDKYSLLGFGNDNIINVITMDGKYYKAVFDPKNGGDCQKIEEKNFLIDL
jgi:WD40 repeat protein